MPFVAIDDFAPLPVAAPPVPVSPLMQTQSKVAEIQQWIRLAKEGIQLLDQARPFLDAMRPAEPEIVQRAGEFAPAPPAAVERALPAAAAVAPSESEKDAANREEIRALVRRVNARNIKHLRPMVAGLVCFPAAKWSETLGAQLEGNAEATNAFLVAVLSDENGPKILEELACGSGEFKGVVAMIPAKDLAVSRKMLAAGIEEADKAAAAEEKAGEGA